MKKIGKIKSWYIDPDDNKLVYSLHNILMVEIIDGKTFYAVHHDSKDMDDDSSDAAIELGKFEFSGMKFNARFDDIYGRTNYTNVTEL